MTTSNTGVSLRHRLRKHWAASRSVPVVSIVSVIAVVGLSGCGASASRTGAAAARDHTVLWDAGMEDGRLGEWYRGDEGGEFNSGKADATLSRRVAHSGSHSARLTWRGPRESGTRLFRWGEPRRFRDLYFEAWLYFPRRYRLTGNPLTGRWLDLFQFKSRSADGRRNDPIWFLNVREDHQGAADGRGSGRPVLVPELRWWPRRGEGPRRGERGIRRFVNRRVSFPIRRWFRIRARLRQSNGFDGIIQFWLGRRRIFNLHNVRTGYRNCRYNPWCVEQHWSVNMYSDGLSPAPAVAYVDDARIYAR